MAAKQPLLNFEGTCIVRFKVKAVSDKAANRKVSDAIRAIYKEVRITEKKVDWLEHKGKEWDTICIEAGRYTGSPREEE
jgi:hypothetical protein